MKDIIFFDSPKYKTSDFIEIEKSVFQYKNLYLTSICFKQEPELGEGTSAKYITQYPLEDVLDATETFIHDFYDDLNTEASDICFLELASPHIENIRAVLKLCGKHIYNKEVNGLIDLIIE